MRPWNKNLSTAVLTLSWTGFLTPHHGRGRANLTAADFILFWHQKSYFNHFCYLVDHIDPLSWILMHSEPPIPKLRAAIEVVLNFFKFVTILRFRTVFGVPQPIFSDLVYIANIASRRYKEWHIFRFSQHFCLNKKFDFCRRGTRGDPRTPLTPTHYFSFFFRKIHRKRILLKFSTELQIQMFIKNA